jgi:hypothetical protein
LISTHSCTYEGNGALLGVDGIWTWAWLLTVAPYAQNKQVPKDSEHPSTSLKKHLGFFWIWHGKHTQAEWHQHHPLAIPEALEVPYYLTSWLWMYHGPHICASPPQFKLWSPSLQCDGIWVCFSHFFFSYLWSIVA